MTDSLPTTTRCGECGKIAVRVALGPHSMAVGKRFKCYGCGWSETMEDHAGRLEWERVNSTPEPAIKTWMENAIMSCRGVGQTAEMARSVKELLARGIDAALIVSNACVSQHATITHRLPVSSAVYPGSRLLLGRRPILFFDSSVVMELCDLIKEPADAER